MSPAIYVYCLVQSPGEPPLAEAPAGLPGLSSPRALALGGGLWAVVADAPLPDYGSEEIERRLADLSWVSDRALAHEQMVEHCAAHRSDLPALPLKLFTLFTSEERALAGLQGRRPEIEQVLRRIAGREEWGVRILFDEAQARRAAAEAREPAASGTGFLLRKKADQEGARQLAGRVRTEAGRAYEELAGLAAEARRREAPPEAGARMLLDAAFLVPRDRADAFEAAVRRWADELAGHACQVTLTGPWPPYNFVGESA